jgi:hypothetical protein
MEGFFSHGRKGEKIDLKKQTKYRKGRVEPGSGFRRDDRVAEVVRKGLSGLGEDHHNRDGFRFRK